MVDVEATFQVLRGHIENRAVWEKLKIHKKKEKKKKNKKKKKKFKKKTG